MGCAVFFNDVAVLGFYLVDVFLALGLVARDAQLARVHHDDEIAGIHVRREFGLVLATQSQRDLGCQAAEHLVGGVDHEPVMRHLMGLGGKRLHRNTCLRNTRPLSMKTG